MREAEQASAERAIAVASRRAPRYLMTPAMLRASITSIDPRTDTYERALTVIERRTVVLGLSPGTGTEGAPLSPLPDPEAINPWKMRIGQLEARPRVVAECPTCQGQRKTRCRTCEGQGQVTCDACRGTARRNGKPCEVCEGAGAVLCESCHRGEIDCPTCAATGRVRAWLALEAKTFSQVTVVSDGSGVEAHVNLRSPGDFDADPARWQNELFHDTGVLPTAEALVGDLIPKLDRRLDRVRSTRVQSFASSVHRLPYGSPFGAGLLEVAGSPPVVTPASVFRPLRLRRAMILLLVAAASWVALMVHHGYVTRHPWFAEHGQGGTVLAFALASAVAAAFAVGGLLVPPRAFTIAGTWAPLVLAGGLVTVTVGATRGHAPRAEGAETLLAAGDLVGARSEAEAVLATSGDRARAQRVLDTVVARSVSAAPTVAEAQALADDRAVSEDARRAMRAEIDERLEKSLSEAEKVADPTALFALGESLRASHPELARRAFATGAARKVSTCVAQAIFPCEIHRGDLPDDVVRSYDRQLEAAYASASLAKGDWDAASARIERWTDPSLVQQSVALRDRGGKLCADALRTLVVRAATTADPTERRDLADQALAVGRSYLRLTGREPSPTLASLSANLASAERTLEQSERRAAAKRGFSR